MPMVRLSGAPRERLLTFAGLVSDAISPYHFPPETPVAAVPGIVTQNPRGPCGKGGVADASGDAAVGRRGAGRPGYLRAQSVSQRHGKVAVVLAGMREPLQAHGDVVLVVLVVLLGLGAPERHHRGPGGPYAFRTT